MLKTVPDLRPDLRAVLELPLAALADYPGTAAVIDRYGTPSIMVGAASLIEALQAAGRWPELGACEPQFTGI